MGILDRAAQRLGYMRQDSAAPAAPLPSAPAPQRRSDDLSSVLAAYANRPQYGGLAAAHLYAADELYGTDGLAAMIVDRPAEDAVARGFRVEGDAAEAIPSELDRLDALPALTEALRWARLHGASAVMPLVEDGLPLDAPLDLGRVRQITDLMVHPASAITMRAERYADPTQPNYGWPVLYDVRPRWGTVFPVHESRLFPVSGDPLAHAAAQNARLPWLGRGVLEGCFADLQRYRDALRLAKLILQRKQQPVHAMSGLGEMLAAGLDDVVAKRLDAADLARNLLTTVAVDAADKFDVIDSSLGGIQDLIRECKIALCASAGVPMVVLFGEQPSGQNATGAGEHEAYHQRLRREQQRLQSAAERLVGLIFAQQSLRRREPSVWQVEWFPLWSPTAQEQAATAKAEADAKKAAVEAIVALTKGGLATPDEARGLVREQVYSTLPTGALPEEDDTGPQAEVENARKAAVETVVALLDAGLVSPEEARDLAREAVPAIPEGAPPEPEPEPQPPNTEAEPDGATEEDRGAGAAVAAGD